jgi:quercetin dioxygenase-like cupin family protein
VTDAQAISLSATTPISHDPGVRDREADVDGTRWALVDYAPGAGRAEWCDTPHSGYVLSGTITYAFDDGRPPLVVGAGDAFLLPAKPRHRGTNNGVEPAQLFIIDVLPS